MKMIRQDDPGIYPEPSLGARVPHGLPQKIHMADKQIAPALL